MAQAGAPVDQASVDKTLASTSLLSGWYRTDTRGHVITQGFSLPEDAMPPGTSQLLNQLIGDDSENMQEFPDEAVGPGARWQLVAHRDLGPFKLTITEDFTLRSRSGNHIVLDMQARTEPSAPAATGNAEPQAVVVHGNEDHRSGQAGVQLHDGIRQRPDHHDAFHTRSNAYDEDAVEDADADVSGALIDPDPSLQFQPTRARLRSPWATRRARISAALPAYRASHWPAAAGRRCRSG